MKRGQLKMSPEELREAVRGAEYLQAVRPVMERMGVPRTSADTGSTRAFAQGVWGLSYRHCRDDEAAFDRLFQWSRREMLANPDNLAASALHATLLVPDQAAFVLWAAKWADCGFPRVQMGHKRAALLMATSITPEVLDAVVPPWRAFHIQVPVGLLTTEDVRSKQLVNIVSIRAQYLTFEDHTPSWNIVAFTDGDTQLWRIRIPTSEFAHVGPETSTDWEQADYLYPLQDRDDRVLLLCSRLVASVCLSMSDPANFTECKKPKLHKMGAHRKRQQKEPVTRDYVLDKPVEFDCRPMLVDYVEHGQGGRRGTPLAVQFQVRSHWRRVVCGVGGSERRVQVISSYWRGPETAPIRVRDTELTA